jgi:hypothetical protein
MEYQSETGATFARAASFYPLALRLTADPLGKDRAKTPLSKSGGGRFRRTRHGVDCKAREEGCQIVDLPPSGAGLAVH